MGNVSKLIEGLIVLKKYYGDDFDIDVGHNILYAASIEDSMECVNEDAEEYVDSRLSESDSILLDQLGWLIDIEYASWAFWV